MKKTALLCLGTALIFAACGNFTGKVKEILAIKTQVEEKFNVKNVGLNVEKTPAGNNLKITLPNTPYNDSSDAAKQTLADSIGAVCSANIHTIKFSGGTVVFSHQSEGGIVKSSTGNGYDMHLKAGN